MRLASVTRHTQRSGTKFEVWYVGGSRESDTPFWTSEDWEHDVAHAFPSRS